MIIDYLACLLSDSPARPRIDQTSNDIYPGPEFTCYGKHSQLVSYGKCISTDGVDYCLITWLGTPDSFGLFMVKTV